MANNIFEDWTKVTKHVRLAEEKIDQFLQGQGPGNIRLGVALSELRAALLVLEKHV